jgi:Ca2+-binding RTX toxin-like protein
LESLESRRLLSVAVEDGTLVVRGTAAGDDISVVRTGIDDVIVRLNGSSRVFDVDHLDESAIRIFGEAGHDCITTGSGITALDVYLEVRGGSGNDSIVGGDNFDNFFGEDGNDTIRGNAGGDLLVGGAGDDSIDGGSGDDTIHGDAGNDTLVAGAGFDGVAGGEGIDSVVGDADEDVLFDGENPGGDDGSVIVDPAGILRISGSPRHDIISGGAADGVITIEYNGVQKSISAAGVIGVLGDVGAGDDYLDLRIQGGAAIQVPATLLGAGGDDQLFGGDGNDSLSGGEGDDWIEGWDGNDTLAGNDGHDRLEGQNGNDSLAGGNGNDYLHGAGGTDTLSGGAGLHFFFDGEVVSGASLPTALTIRDSALVFTGTERQDLVAVWKNPANDLVVWIDGQTYVVDKNFVVSLDLRGNGGDDVLRLDPTFDMGSTILGGLGNDRLIGGARSDFMGDQDGNDLLVGNGDQDRLDGGEGNDTLDGGSGPDFMRGGGGRDTVDYSSRTRDLVINQSDQDTANDGEADEFDLVAVDIEQVRGGSGNDRFIGSGADNAYFGGPGNDVLSGFGDSDALFGEAGNDLLVGGANNDFLFGGSGDDSLYGQDANDVLEGQDGDDLLSANDNHRDTVNGGNDADTARVDSLDVVTNVETRA